MNNSKNIMNNSMSKMQNSTKMLIKTYFSIVSFVLIPLTLNSQLKNSSSPLDNIQLNKINENNNFNEIKQRDEFPIGNVIDANYYLVGPSDILAIQILPFEMVPNSIIVSNECTIIHQRFGEISLKGLTLQQVRDSVMAISNQRKEGSKVTISLIQARKVLITIKGNVANPGTYMLPASYSVSTAVRFANQQQTQSLTQELTMEEISALTRAKEGRKEREKIFSESGISEYSIFSTRYIRLVRSNGYIAGIVDIERANATQNPSFDPFISEGDEIFVPYEEVDYPAISIAGEVIRPASLVYKTGDMVSHLLKMGYGFTDDADLDNVILHSSQGSQKLTVDTLGNLLSKDMKINPGSAIIVGNKTERIISDFGIISVKGEVNKPNIYVIIKGKTKLKDAIEMAGGFTKFAHLPLASVGRRDNSQNERISLKRRFNQYFQGSDLTIQDTMRLGIEIDLKLPRVSCDFVSVFENNSEEYNIYLRDGDVIDVPSKPNRVNVFGQVNRPGFVDFEENRTMEWYIMKAGGYSKGAARDRARIIRGNNRVWEDGFVKFTYVYDGDEIFVPTPREVTPEMQLQRWATIAGLTATIASVLAFVYSIYRDQRDR